MQAPAGNAGASSVSSRSGETRFVRRISSA